MSGSHHDGSSHSGEHHYSGGSGSGSFGGGFGSSSSSSSGFFGSDGAVDGETAAGPEFFKTVLLWFSFPVSITAIYYANSIMGYNHLSMFFVCAALTIYLLYLVKRTDFSEIHRLKDYQTSSGNPIYNKYSCEGEENVVTDGFSWCSKKKFYIDMYERSTKDENIRLTHEAIKGWPKILKISELVFPIFSLAWAILAFFLYEMIIPVFESATMSDEAFKFIDNLVFYLPSIMALLGAIALIIVDKVREKFLHKLCIKLIENNKSKKDIKKISKTINEIKKKKWYFNNCPNCGTESMGAVCLNCGSSLEIMDDVMSYDVSARHQVL